MNLDKFTLKAQDAMAVAQQIASEYGNQQLEPEHVIMAMLRDSEGIIPIILKKLVLIYPPWKRVLSMRSRNYPKFRVAVLPNFIFPSVPSR